MGTEKLYFLDLMRTPWPYSRYLPYLIVGLAGALAMYFLITIRGLFRMPLASILPGFLDALPVGLIAIDFKGTITVSNGNAEQILHISRKRLHGKKYRDVFRKGDVSALLELAERGIVNDEEQSEHFQLSLNDETKEIDAKVSPLFDNRGRKRGTLLTLRDVTGPQTRWIESWIETAQDLAHEIKSGLNRISLTIQNSIVSETSAAPAKETEQFESFNVEIRRLRNVANGFLRFLKLGEMNPQPCNVNEMIEEMMDEISLSFPEGTTLRKTLDEKVPTVQCDPEQFRMVLNHIIENARNAMTTGGSLTIATSHTQRFSVKDKKVFRDYVTIEVTDTGTGIPQAHLDKVFEPGFTTTKEGAGLGLVIVKRIVEGHGGTIHIESHEGKGTIVTIEFPI